MHNQLMNVSKQFFLSLLFLFLNLGAVSFAFAQVGVGTKAPKDAEVLFDGSRKMLDQKWTYWQGPRLSASLPLKWQIVKDPVGKGTVLSSNDPAGAGGKYGAADIVTKKNMAISAYMWSF
jgi:hypothetical protein